jgi:hypothetical protein
MRLRIGRGWWWWRRVGGGIGGGPFLTVLHDRLVMTDRAPGGCAEYGMVAGIMAGDPANRRARQATGPGGTR